MWLQKEVFGKMEQFVGKLPSQPTYLVSCVSVHKRWCYFVIRHTRGVLKVLHTQQHKSFHLRNVWSRRARTIVQFHLGGKEPTVPGGVSYTHKIHGPK